MWSGGRAGRAANYSQGCQICVAGAQKREPLQKLSNTWTRAADPPIAAPLLPPPCRQAERREDIRSVLEHMGYDRVVDMAGEEANNRYFEVGVGVAGQGGWSVSKSGAGGWCRRRPCGKHAPPLTPCLWAGLGWAVHLSKHLYLGESQ